VTAARFVIAGSPKAATTMHPDRAAADTSTTRNRSTTTPEPGGRPRFAYSGTHLMYRRLSCQVERSHDERVRSAATVAPLVQCHSPRLASLDPHHHAQRNEGESNGRE
jgi:hypothetical protein